jgi:hypothetical protein
MEGKDQLQGRDRLATEDSASDSTSLTCFLVQPLSQKAYFCYINIQYSAPSAAHRPLRSGSSGQQGGLAPGVVASWWSLGLAWVG